MPKLKGYHRPSTVDEALQLLSRPGLCTGVVGGGTYITAHMSDAIDEIVDLQATGLTEVTYALPHHVTLGAMVRLQDLVEDDQIPTLLRQTARRAGPNTIRNAATVGGVVASVTKESEFVAALLVFEAEVQVQSTQGSKTIPLTTFLLDVPAALSGGVITAVTLALGGKTATARVTRTPADSPIVAAVARLAEDGKLRLALCGVAPTPALVDPENVKAAINPQGDFRGSREYRRQMAAVLTERVLKDIQG